MYCGSVGAGGSSGSAPPPLDGPPLSGSINDELRLGRQITDIADKRNLQGWPPISSETNTGIIVGGGSVHGAGDCRSVAYHQPSVNREKLQEL